jgi:bifunctional DNA-binding transcriptional regulator/antitoxin component of YhaV-PrlF toxin-antitoxin module
LEEIPLELEIREIGKGTLGIVFPKYVRDKLAVEKGQKILIFRKSDEVWFKLERGK